MGLQQLLTWQDYFLIAPLYVRYFPDDDLSNLSDEALILRVQAIPAFDDCLTTPDLETLKRLRWLILDLMNKEEVMAHG